ncbi:MAG: hypothetical protein IT454_13195 [Planctomycetes bacterium]|nr:hypothetical protein [Planctomycetota bacterium]
MRHTLLCAVFAVSFAASCATTTLGSDPSGDWLRPSPMLKRQIEDQIERLPWTHGVERIEQIQWFASVGEPAYADLMRVCVDPRPDVAASAVAALGATGDSRLVEALKALDWPASDDAALAYEKARAYLRLGDWSHVDVLVAGLEEDSDWARAWCAAALKESTRLDFGFEPAGDPAARAASIAKWREWIVARSREGLVADRSR